MKCGKWLIFVCLIWVISTSNVAFGKDIAVSSYELSGIKEILFEMEPSWEKLEKRGKHSFTTNLGATGYSTFAVQVVDKKNDNIFDVHVFNIVEYQDKGHTATIGWYRVDITNKTVYDTLFKKMVFAAKEALPQSFSKNDLYIQNADIVQLDSYISLNDAASILGPIDKVSFNEEMPSLSAVLQKGNVVIVSREYDEKGQIIKFVTTSADFSTNRGIKVGDTMEQVRAKYGEPTQKIDYLNYVGIKYWEKYQLSRYDMHRLIIGFGSDGKVEAIGVSIAPAGL